MHSKVFAWITLADERHLRGTWVAGRKRFASAADAAASPVEQQAHD
ncbi:MAG: hypothetical protein U1F25_03235 [Rubrivivax sp.]